MAQSIDMSNNQGDNLISVYEAPDEITANIVASLLESEGIKTTIVSSASVWGERAAILDIMQRKQSRYWGDVVVAECDVQRSREVISTYQPEEESKEEKPQLNWEKSYSHNSLRIPCVYMAFVFCATSFIIWYGDSLLQTCMTFCWCFFTLLYAWWIIASLKYIPQQYIRNHKATGYYLFIGALLLLLMGLWSTGALHISKNVITVISIIAAIAFVYGAAKRYSSSAIRLRS